MLTGSERLRLDLVEDNIPGELTFKGAWTPRSIGSVHLDYRPRVVQGAHPASRSIDVLGILRLGPIPERDLGMLSSESEAITELDLGSFEIRGRFELSVTSDFERERSLLEIERGEGWQALGETPVPVTVTDGSLRRLALRLRVGSCPEAHPPEEPVTVSLRGTNARGQEVSTIARLRLEILADPWWICWWPVLVGLGVAAIVGILVHGYWAPSRFPPRLGVVLSPEEDIEEGFWHSIRGQRGAGVGFYRDARIHITSDFRLTSSERGALACLRAQRGQIKIAPAAGTAVWRQNLDGEWEPLPAEESTARYGVVYRDELGTLFFTLRNG